MHDNFIPEGFDVITEDFDVGVFLDLLHWSWEDAQKDTHEPERPVSPFPQPPPRNREPAIPPKEPIASQYDSSSCEEQRLNVDSQASSSSKSLKSLYEDECFGISHSTTILPASDSLPSRESSQSIINHDISPKAQASNLNRSASRKTDTMVSNRICRETTDVLSSVTEQDLLSMPELPVHWETTYYHHKTPCHDIQDFHKSTFDEISIDEQLGASFDNDDQ
ncbi:hypothetical protein F25303_10513 [Fusarium sp. NRRL 25303]|nr:hypothetical protein F25303_10513 [Fusarium sp. NRRL 25303]